MKSPHLLTFSLLLVSLISDLTAQERIVGFVRVDCPSGSDTLVSVPFRQNSSFEGELNATPTPSSDSAILSNGDNPGWAVDQFVTAPSYLRFTSGTRAGYVFSITANLAATVTIALDGDDFSGVATSDEFEILPHWTLDLLFPAASQNTVHASSSVFPTARKTEIQFFNQTKDGIDLAPSQIYFLENTIWRQSVKGFPDAGSKVVPPGSSFIIRHPATEAATQFVTHQRVDSRTFVTRLKTLSDGENDSSLALVRPVAVKLEDLNLTAANGFVESASTDEASRKDELHLFDNAAAAINRTPSAVYFRTGNQWVLDDGNAYPVSDDTEISPAVGLLLRKASTVDAADHVWINTPAY